MSSISSKLIIKNPKTKTMPIQTHSQSFMSPILSFLIFLACSINAEPQTIHPTLWATVTQSGKQTLTTLQFYFHDRLTGRNPTAIMVAQSSQTRFSSTLFGTLMMIDDLLTVGPDLGSKVVGRAKGMYGFAGQFEPGLIMTLNYGFSDGMYNDSSFSLLSVNHVSQPVREMAVVGGTGLFRLARGYAVARTYWFDGATGDAVVGYNVTIVTDHLSIN